MGDSACIVRSFSYAPAMPSESKQGNLMLALGDSVSFGRFMNESLSWGKWSTFSQKNYVEEAERYAQPGSVAQKKAFFEAHYKRAAAKKVEQGSAIELEGAVHDNDEQVRFDARSDVDVGRMEEKVNQGMNGGEVDYNEHSSAFVEETSKDGRHGSICADDVLEESHRGIVSSSRNPTSKVDQPLPKQDFAPDEKQVLPHHEQHNSSNTTARAESESINLAVTTQSENRTGSPLNSSASGSRSDSLRRHLLSAVSSKSLEERNSSKRKQKLEEKFNASQVQKMQQQKTKKDQVGNRFGKLRCIFCFKASPTLDDEKESADKMEQCAVSALPPPPPPPPTSIAKNL